MKTKKQILASFLVMAMFITGLMITPMDAKAATEYTVVDDTGAKYILDTEKYNFTTFWKADADKRTAPTKIGYVFGGWYKNDGANNMKAITQADAEKITDGAGIYAKFVPAEVLSIRAQLEKDTETYDGKTADGSAAKASTYLRLLSAVNGLDYQSVGFDIYYNKKHHETNEIATNITKVFSKITNEETGKSGMVASKLFGSAATHFSVLRLDQILSQNFEKVIYVTPQWTTLDGTLVEGQAKYVRVMDGYASNRFISVPVNFLEGEVTAAGQMELQYSKFSLEVVDYDEGLLMPEMAFYDNTEEGVVKIVGNIANPPAEGANGVEPETEIYANVWFKVKEDATENPDFYTFTMDGMSFCNWDEQMVDVTAWDVTYLK